jgi:hypothetical protein
LCDILKPESNFGRRLHGVAVVPAFGWTLPLVNQAAFEPVLWVAVLAWGSAYGIGALFFFQTVAS